MTLPDSETIGPNQTQHANARACASKPRSRADWASAYFKALAAHGQKVRAAAEAKIDRSTVWDRRQSDPAFAEAEAQAIAMAVEALESEAHRRAMGGEVEEHFDKAGRLIRRRKIFSDLLLLRALVKAETGSWRERNAVEVANASDDFATLTREERKAKLAKARAARDAPL
jgi:hypothetical protein